jgi:hypothetical protein
MPDLLRAHGVWVWLAVSVASGALWAREALLVPALLAGTAHAGAFVLVASAFGRSGDARTCAKGAAIAVAASLLAVWLGAPRAFLALEALTLVPAAGALLAAGRFGPLSRPTLAAGALAVAMAAPVTACAGGVAPARAALLALLLAPFFAWRAQSVVVRPRTTSDGRRESLRARGLREAGFAAAWSLGIAALVGA